MWSPPHVLAVKKMGKAEAFLTEIESLRGKDPKGALRRVERESPALHEAFGVGAPLHGPFRTVVSTLQAQIDPRRPPAVTPDAFVLGWDAVPDLGTLVAAAREGTAEVLYLAPSDPRHDATPMAQLRALDEFADPRVAMVVVGEGPPILLRRGVLLSAAATLNPRTDIADVPQDILDFAEQSGYTTRFTR